MIEVILLERVDRLGALGDVVKVRPGYARNFLLPQKKALRATKSNILSFEARKAELAAKADLAKAEAEKAKKKLEGLSLRIVRQASEAGQLYGSVTARDVVDAATEKGATLERRFVEFAQAIKSVGVYPVRIKLHPDVSVDIQLVVGRSAEDAEKILKDDRKAKQAAAEVKEAGALGPRARDMPKRRPKKQPRKPKR